MDSVATAEMTSPIGGFRLKVLQRQLRATRRERIATQYWEKLPPLDREYLLYNYGVYWLHEILRRGIRVKRVKYV